MQSQTIKGKNKQLQKIIKIIQGPTRKDPKHTAETTHEQVKTTLNTDYARVCF
jgi:hypothetical protein